jgi:hypothetical protein
MYSKKDESICKLLNTSCNIEAKNVDICTWWKKARKWIPTNISHLHNDKSTAMKWAFLGKYCSIIYSMNQNMSNNYDVFSLVDWLTHSSKITQALHKDVICTVLYCLNKVLQKAGKKHTRQKKEEDTCLL